MKYACELCGMVYNEEVGDPVHGVAAGTAFAEVPEDYECPGCGSKKEAFNKLTPKLAVTPNLSNPTFWNKTKYSDHKESER